MNRGRSPSQHRQGQREFCGADAAQGSGLALQNVWSVLLAEAYYLETMRTSLSLPTWSGRSGGHGKIFAFNRHHMTFHQVSRTKFLRLRMIEGSTGAVDQFDARR